MNRPSASRPQNSRRHACDRCRRQKLRCDREKPCALCVRSGFQCTVTGILERNNKSQPSRQPRLGARNSQSRPVPVEISCPPESFDHGLPHHSPLDGRAQDATASPVPSLSGLQGPTPSLRSPEGSSSLELTHQLLSRNNDAATHSMATFAIPGAGLSPEEAANRSRHSGRVLPLSQMLGQYDLPSREVCHCLFNGFLDSVHWFMIVFHEPSLRILFDEIVETRSARIDQLRVVMLILTILLMGARYASRTSIAGTCLQDIDLEELQSAILDRVKIHFFDIMNDVGVESVQVCILLGSFYLYTGKPNLALAVLGAGIRSAQALNLHCEPLWGNIDDVTRETRKRAWWAIYNFDRFASLIYGRPSSIRDSDCDVQNLGEMEDTNLQHPYLRSTLNAEKPPATILTYQVFKNELYGYAASTVTDIYLPSRAPLPSAFRSAVEINNRLVAWFDSLPVELRLETHSTSMIQDASDDNRKICMTFALQALALQLAYDNIQIVLHRPFLRYNVNSFNRSRFAKDSSGLASSAEQCFYSALRTCTVGLQRQKILLAARGTHAGAYLAIQNFTAGVTLSIIALSRAMPRHVQEAKQGVAHAISLQRLLSESFTVSAQTVKVLERLLQLIFAQEMEQMLETANTGINDVHTPYHDSTLIRGEQRSAHDLGANTPRDVNAAETALPTDIDVEVPAINLEQWEYLSHNSQIDNAIYSVQDVLGSTASPALRDGFTLNDAYSGSNTGPSQLYEDLPSFDHGNPLTESQFWIWNVDPFGER